MYVPDAFAEDRPEVLADFIRGNSFATVISTGAGGVIASHLPVLLDESRGERGVLRSHMARANPQWRTFSPETEVLVVFHGPHAYVSPAWYTSTAVVPTWNYVAVHVYGRPRVMDDAAEVRRLLNDTVQTYEGGRERPWVLGSLPEGYVTKLAEGIVGFEVTIGRIEGKWKLGQNRGRADRQGVIAALERSDDAQARAVARLMAERL